MKNILVDVLVAFATSIVGYVSLKEKGWLMNFDVKRLFNKMQIVFLEV